MTTSRHVTQVDLRIKVACVVAFVFTVPPLMIQLVPTQDPDTFWAGFKEGIYDASMCRSLISASLTVVIYAFRPSRWTFIASAFLSTIAIIQFGLYIRAFPNVMRAVMNLLPWMACSLTLSLNSWVEYTFTYWAIAKGGPD